MIASLPMYDRPETAAAYDRFWAGIAARIGCPDVDLSRSNAPEAAWTSPDLLLSQTCGLPYRRDLKDRVTYVGTPDYGLEGCPPGYYCSVIVTRADAGLRALYELDGAPMAVNSISSQSGWAAPVNAGVKPGRLMETGSHRASAEAVRNGDAVFAAIDAQTWRMIQRWDDLAGDLVVIARTDPTPGLPLITAQTDRVDDLRAAISAAIAELRAEDRDTLNILSLVRIPKTAYLAVPTPTPI